MMEKSRMLQTRGVGVMEDYCKLMIHLGPSIVPGREWEMVKKGQNTFSDIVTSTDEAHALLVIENNWNRLKFGVNLEGGELQKCNNINWMSEEETEEYGTEQPRYTRTDSGRPKNGRQGKTGWSQAGLNRFNQLVELVRNGRTIRDHVFNSEVTKQCRAMTEDKLRKRKRKRGRNQEEEEAYQKLEQFQVACDFNYEAV
jgi:hypothetical protein